MGIGMVAMVVSIQASPADQYKHASRSLSLCMSGCQCGHLGTRLALELGMLYTFTNLGQQLTARAQIVQI